MYTTFVPDEYRGHKREMDSSGTEVDGGKLPHRRWKPSLDPLQEY